MAEVSMIQILDKKNYFDQALVSLPNASPLPPLGDSSLRLKTEIMCLTVNNFTYAKLGHLLHWWDIHPLPSDTPAPYNDPSIYGRINCWGYAKVLESTFAGVPEGSYLWGYLPIGTLPQDLQVEAGDVSDQVLVTSGYRQHVMPIYNRYFVSPASLGSEIEHKADGVAYDALFRIMHETAYLMAQYVFCPNSSDTIQGTAAESSDLSDAIVLVFAPGSKAALCFASMLRDGREGAKPARVVGVTSEYSKAFVDATGLYDQTALTSANPTDVLSSLGADTQQKVVVFDFGGRAGVAFKWAMTLKPTYTALRVALIGSAITDPAESAGSPPPAFPEGLDVLQLNADVMRTAAMQKTGEVKYFEDIGNSWQEFRSTGVRGFKVNWGEGMDDVIQGWDRLARGEVTPDEGLAFKL
ncbi:hypothetical protein F5Y15DRAFT_399734 [Xylariaceae sp. FL0016]|nr:hypothetical protein F5Y15DRAFT_399734 [Xylariaceae sp. FL0016]